MTDFGNLCCFSSTQNKHNILAAGDLFGNGVLLDLAKNSIFSKIQLQPEKRVIHISDCLIDDTYDKITTVSFVLNQCPRVYIARYSHNNHKLHLQY